MRTDSELSISRWETALSDLDGLFFVSFLDRGATFCLTVENREDQHYEVIFENPGPYRMADEELLTHYWGRSDSGRGWTFRVEGASWHEDFELLELYGPDLTHFVIATYSGCLEVLCQSEPRIRAV